MLKLTDKEIRGALRRYLEPSNPTAVLEELRVHNGSAIADVVAIYDFAHCFEIKGETDEVRRIERQGRYYNLAFRTISLVTTQNHLQAALRLAPSHWGVLVAEWGTHGVEIRPVRAAKENPDFHTRTALLTLWKSELVTLCEATRSKPEKLSRASLSELIAQTAEAAEISMRIGELLVKRQTNNECPLSI